MSIWAKLKKDLRRRKQGEPASGQAAPSGIPTFEQLEPRILLSGEDLGAGHEVFLPEDDPQPVIEMELTVEECEEVRSQKSEGRSEGEKDESPSDSLTVEQSNCLSVSQLASASDLITIQQNENQTSLLDASEDLEPETENGQLPQTSVLSSAQNRGPPLGSSGAVHGTLVFAMTTDRNDLTLRFDDTGVFELLDNQQRETLIRRSATDVRDIVLYGTDAADDILRVDLSASQRNGYNIQYYGGEGGYDSLVIVGSPSLIVDYTAIGADSGTIVLSNGEGCTTVSFSGLEPVTITDVSSYSFNTNAAGTGTDIITIDSPAPGQNRISGTSGGVAFESVTFYSVVDVTIDTGANDAAGEDADTIHIDAAGLVASGLESLAIVTGGGNDTITVVPSPQATITVDGELGIDSLFVDTQGRDTTFSENGILVEGMQLITYSTDTEEVALVPGVFEVSLYRAINYHTPERPGDDVYEYGLEFDGVGITDIEITTPWGEAYDLAALVPAGWNGQGYVEVQRGALDFDFERDPESAWTWCDFGWKWLSASQWASLGTAQTLVSITYGDSQNWQANLDFAGVTQPQREPSPVSPVHRQIESGQLTVEWALWEEAPSDGIVHIWLEENVPDWVGESSWYEETDLPASATSWGPISLPNSLCDLELVFGQIQQATVDEVLVNTVVYTESTVTFLADPEGTLEIDPATGNRYFLTPPGTWEECQAFAEYWGGNLTTIDSAQQEQWLQQQYGNNESFWLGFNDIAQEGSWEWVSGDAVTYTNWAPGEPNDYLGEDAAAMNSNPGGQWNDLSLNGSLRGIVMIPAGVPVIPQDDHGNTSVQATSLAAPATVGAELSYNGDIDFFSFDATAGQTYEILVSPTGGDLDSTLWLYDVDGSSLLAWDDDGGAHGGSRIIYTVPTSGVYHLAVDAHELWDDDLGAYTLEISESSLTADVPAATFSHPTEFVTIHKDRAIAFSRSYTGSTSGSEGEILHLLDLTDPLAPIELGGYFAGGIEGGFFNDTGQFCYVADDSNTWGPQDSGHSELVVLDLRGAGDPVELRRIAIQQLDVDSIVRVGDYLYVGSQPEDETQAFLEIHDIADPGNPVFVGQTDAIVWPGQSRDCDPIAITVSKDRAYILHLDNLISIVDVANPVAPQLLGQYGLAVEQGQYCDSIAVSGDILLAGCGWQVHVIDVSAPVAPQQLAVLDLGGQVGEIFIRGERAYIGLTAKGIAVVDISSPSQPEVLEQTVVNGATGDVAVSAGHVLVPTGISTSIFDAGILPYVVDYHPDGISYPPVASVELVFDRPMDPSSFSLTDDIVSFAGPGGALVATGYSWTDAYTLEVSFDSQTRQGVYEMVIGPEILDLQGNPLDQDGDGTPGEQEEDCTVAEFTIERICEVFLDRGIYYGRPDTGLDDAFEYAIEAVGLAITQMSVTTPWGETFDSVDYMPIDWSGEFVRQEVGGLEFAAGTENDMRWISVTWAQLDPAQWSALDAVATQIVVDYLGGTWTDTVDFSQVLQPTQEPTLTFPIHEQADVGLVPTIQWQEWTPAPARGQVEVELFDITVGEVLYEQVFGPDAVSFQTPEILQPSHRYTIETEFGDHMVATIDGVDVHVWAQAGSETEFETAEFGLGEIWIERGIDYEVPGRPEDDTYVYGMEFTGAGITDIGITAPWGRAYELGQLLPANWNGQDYVEIQRGALGLEVWQEGGLTFYEFYWDWLSDSQWASLSTGHTHVSVDYGDGQNWQADLDFLGVTQPQREPNPVNPIQREIKTGDLTVEWALWEDAPADGIIHVGMEGGGTPWNGGTGWEEEADLPGTAMSWGPLSLPASIYELWIDFGQMSQQTIGDVSINAVAYTENEVTFLTDMSSSLTTDPVSGYSYFLTPPGTWGECQAFAEYWGGNLVTISSARQELWLQQRYGFDELYWIGLNDIAQAGVWEWVNGDPVTYTNWTPNSPYVGDDGTVMNGNPAGQWSTVPAYIANVRGIVMVPAGVPVIPPDDHGNTSGQATTLVAPATVSAELSYYGDIDFFSFDATAGQAYEILVRAAGEGLDSTLWLYDTDGNSLLAWDDDGGTGPGSRIVYTVPTSGIYYLAVDAYELWDDDLGPYTLEISESSLVADVPAATFSRPTDFMITHRDRAIAGSRPYTGSTGASEDVILQLLDLTEPLTPIVLGGYFTGEIAGVVFNETAEFAYLADDGNAWRPQYPGHSELVVLDLRGPGDPVELDRIAIQQFDVDSIVRVGRHLYVGSQPEDETQAFLEIYDISDPGNPVFVGQTDAIVWPGQSWGFDPMAVTVSQGRAYILHEDNLISIVDVANPVAQQLLSQYELAVEQGQYCDSIAVAGDTLLAGTGWQMHVIDVSDPVAPQELAVLDLGGQVGDIFIRGERAYIGLTAIGVAVVDISSPSQPEVLEQYVVNGATGDVAVSAGHVLVPTGISTSIFDAGILPYVADYHPDGTSYLPVASVELVFDRPVEPSSFSLTEDIVSFTGPGGTLVATGYDWQDAYILRLGFDPQTAIGSYEIVIGPDIIDLQGNRLDQDGDGVPGESQDDRMAAEFTIALPPPEIVGGHIAVNTVWDNTAIPYVLEGDLYIDPGVTLTLAAGVELRSDDSSYDIFVDGRLEATDATVGLHDSTSALYVRTGGELSVTGGMVNGDGHDVDVFVQDGGLAELTGVAFDGSYVRYEAGSAGTIDNCTGNWNLAIHSAAVTVDQATLGSLLVSANTTVTNSIMAAASVTNGSPVLTGNQAEYISLSGGGTATVSGNTLTSDMPLRLADPDVDTSEVTGNTHESSDPWIQISGTLDASRMLGVIDTVLGNYRLGGNLTLASGATLTLAPGVALRSDSSSHGIFVDGRLEATDATVGLHGVSGGGMWGGSLSYSKLYVRNGGQLSLNGVAVNGHGHMGIYVQDGGSADLAGVAFDGPSVQNAAGSAGTIDNCTGTWNLEIHSAAVAVDQAILGSLSVSAGATVTNSTMAAASVTNGSPVLTGNQAEYITLSGAGTATVSGNTLTSAMPLHLADPDVDTSGVSGNTYGSADPWVQISGTLDASRTLRFVDTALGNYRLGGNLMIASGATLTLAPGVELRSDSSSHGILVDGRLEATDATVGLHGVSGGGMWGGSLSYSKLYVRNGGQLSLNGSAVNGHGYMGIYVQDGGSADLAGVAFDGLGVRYEAGSAGTIDNCTGNWNLDIHSAAVAVDQAILGSLSVSAGATVTNSTMAAASVTNGSPMLTGNQAEYISLSGGGTATVSGNTLTSDMPLHLADPDVDTSGVSGNTYESVDPWIQIRGTLDTSRTLGFIDTVLGKYRLGGNLTIASGATLTLTPGVELRSDSSGHDGFVDGRLEATDATVGLHGVSGGGMWGGSLSYSKLYVRNGGQLSLNGSAVSGHGYMGIYVQDGGSADLAGVAFDGPSVQYAAGSAGTIDHCTGTWNLEIHSAAVTVDQAILGSLSVSADATVTNSIMAAASVTNGSPVLTGNQAEYITLSGGGTATVSGNTLTSDMPLYLDDPDADTSGITGNTYESSDPWIQIRGTLNAFRTLGFIDTVLGKYKLGGNLTIASGATLTLASGVEMRGDSSTYDILVDGRLEATDATVGLLGASGGGFMGGGPSSYSELHVRNGGQLSLNDAAVSGHGTVGIHVQNGGLAELTGVVFDGPGVRYEAGSAGTVTNLQGHTHFSLDSEAALEITGNDFTNITIATTGTASATIDLRGNYWGTGNPAFIEDKITHHADDPSLPWADYSDWLIIPYPDLAVSDVNAPTLTIDDPASVTVSWTVENQGSGPSEVDSWIDAVVVSDNTTAGDQDDIILAEFEHAGVLAVGDSYARSETFSLPPALTGRYHLFVRTDIEDTVFEDGFEENNAAESGQIFDVMPIPYADLIVADVQVPQTGFSGQPMAVVWTVTNQGIGTTNLGSWRERVWLSEDPEGTNRIAGIGGFTHYGHLAVGGSYERTGHVVLPHGLDGTYYVVVTTGGPFEFIHTDNNNMVSAAFEIELTPPPDIVVTDISAPETAEEGSLIDVSWTVTNQGAGAAAGSWKDVVYLQRVSDPTGPRIELGHFTYEGILEAGTSYTRWEVLQLPGHINDLYQVVVTSNYDHGNDLYEHGVTDNNTSVDDQALAVTIKPRPDLQIAAVTVPSEVDAGATFSVEFEVINQGTAATTIPNWHDRIYLSLDNVVGYDDILIDDLVNQSALEPGERYLSVSDSIVVPLRFRGEVFVLVSTDANGQMDEWPNETNNVLAAPVYVNPLPLPDLVTSDVVCPQQAVEGAQVEVRYTVTNLGSGETLTPTWTDTIWLTRDKNRPHPGLGDVLLATVEHTGSLSVGAGYDQVLTVRLAQGLASGTYYIMPWSDPYDVVIEDTLAVNANPDDPHEIDNNNYRARAIDILGTPLPLPDLIVTAVSTATSALGGDELTVTWTVENQGSRLAQPGGWVDYIYLCQSLDEEPSPHNSLFLTEVQHLTPLGAGESYTDTATISLPPAAAGQYVVVVTDGSGRVAESHEQNNQLATGTNVTPVSADLVVTDISVPSQSFSGEKTVIEYTVTNIGDHPVWSGTRYWTDYVWLSADPVFIADRATYLNKAIHSHDAPLQPGESYTAQVEVTLPAGISGDYYVYMHIDIHNEPSGILWSRFMPIVDTDWWPADTGSNDKWLEHFSRWAYEDPHNNVGNAPLSVTYREPDLQVTDLTVPTAAVAGQTLSVTYAVSNEGTRNTREVSDTDGPAWYDRVFLSRDPSLDGSDLYLGEFEREEALAVGDSYTATLDVRLPDGIDGDFFVLAFADSIADESTDGRFKSDIGFRLSGISFSNGVGMIAEFQHEGNNISSAALPVTMSQAPDLQVTALTVPERMARGQEFLLTYTVSNLGGAIPDTQQIWDDLVYLSRDEFPDLRADRYMGVIAHTDGLGAGQDYTIETVFTVPTDMLGPYYVFVITDPIRDSAGGRVFEHDAEHNNTRSGAVPMIIELPPATDLEVVGIVIPDSAQAGDPIQIQWTVGNTSSEPASGIWSDSVYLSTDATWDITDRPMGRVSFAGELVPGQTYTSTLEAFLPPAVPGQYRIIVRTDIFNQVWEDLNDVNNKTASPTTLTVGVEEIVLDIPHDITLSTGQDRLLQVTVSQDQTLCVTLTAGDEQAANELFVRHLAAPTSAAYDAGYEGGLSPVQKATIPLTEPGVYYILVRGFSEPADNTPAMLLAELLPLTITDVFTDMGGDEGFVTTTLRGARFHEDAIVKLVRPGFAEYEPLVYEVIDSTKIIATFDLTDAPHGLYDVKVINPAEEQAIIPYRFQVERALEPDVTIGVGGPRIILAGDIGTYSVALQSTSNVDTPYIYFEVGIPELGINAEVYGLPYVQFFSNVRGAPEGGGAQDLPWASLDSAVNTTGQIMAPGYLFDHDANGFTGFTFNVATYPGLKEMHDRAWEEFKEAVYSSYPLAAEQGLLDEGPQGLDVLWDSVLEKALAQMPADLAAELLPDLENFGLADLWNSTGAVPSKCVIPFIPFRFHVTAAATAMSRGEFVAHVSQEALQLRQNILQDSEATAALLTLAADETSWVELYLAALEEADLLRAQGATPPIREHAQIVSLMATLATGILVGPAGSEVRSSGSLVEFFEQIHQWYGDTPGQIAEIEYWDHRVNQKCGIEYDIPVPAIQQFEDYDLALSQQTHFESFRVYVPWTSFESRGAGLPAEFQISGPPPVDGEDFDPLDLSVYLGDDAAVGSLASLTGPLTVDTDGFLPVGHALPYTIQFQNDPAASTHSNEIRIVTALDNDLEPRQFRLGDIKVGDINIHLPSDRALFQGDFDFTEAKGFILRISAGVDVASHQATWLIQAIDPLTGELLQDPGRGLLPPNNAQGHGAGFVSYTVQPVDDVETGAEISAQARVLLNNAPPEDTQTLTHVVDAVAPTTALTVQRLSADADDYLVEWDATDDPGGSGVQYVTIYVAADGGNFEIWQRQVEGSAGSAVFEGTAGHSYEFLALATDIAGMRELPPFGVAGAAEDSAVNLGAAPTVPETTPATFGIAPEPSSAPPTNPLFEEAEQGIPAAEPTYQASEFDEVLRPFVARAFATGIEQSHADIGPMALAEAPDGTIIVSGGFARKQLFRFSPEGGPAAAPWAELDYPIFNLAFDAHGNLWATTGGGPLLQLDPGTGQILNEFADGLTIALAVQPDTNLIYVSSGQGIEIFDPVTQTFEHYSRDVNLRVGSLAFAPDGSLWAVTWPDRRQVVRFNERARAETVLEFDTDIDSIAFGQTGTLLQGLLFVSHNHGQGSQGSELTMVELATLRKLAVARGGSRGDVVITTSQGRVLLSQSSQVDVLNPAVVPIVIATNPPDQGLVALPFMTSAVVFDQDMLDAGPVDPASVLNTANYAIVGETQGEVAIESVVYVPETHTVLLTVLGLQPDAYQFTIADSVSSLEGLSLDQTHVSHFSAISNLSAHLQVEFSTARSSRADQTLSYDVTLTNIGDHDLLLPLILVLDPAQGYEGAPVNALGQAPDGRWFVDLSPAASSGQRLTPGETTTGSTITISNPGNQRVDYTAGAAAEPAPNEACLSGKGV